MAIANKKKTFLTISLTFILAASLLTFQNQLKFIDYLNWKTYDLLVRIGYSLKTKSPACNDVVFVTIGNPTLKNMPESWPYPRSYFATVIENLKNAGARIIAFDFAFFGKSDRQEDLLLKNLIENDKRVILAASVDEEGELGLYSNAGFKNATSGIVTKFQDSDGVTRKNLMYLVNDNDSRRAYLSWGMQILKTVEDIDPSSIVAKEDFIVFQNPKGKNWLVPVDPDTKSFLINFRYHTKDFQRVSFYKAYLGDFDSNLVKDKIVLIGLVSSLFGDLHNTPLGFLPGITLNANAFLTLYNKDFLKNIPKPIQWQILIIGLILAGFLVSRFKTKFALVLISIQIVIFLLISYFLLTKGYIWYYSPFCLAILICPFLAKKLM